MDYHPLTALRVYDRWIYN